MQLIAVHSSAELYGSDRSLLTICTVAVNQGHQVTVLLPEDGPLADEMRRAGVGVRLAPLAVVRRTIIKQPREWFRFAGALLSAWRNARSLVVPGSPAVVLSNTTAVQSGRVIARRLRIPHVQMVREIFVSTLERALFAPQVRAATQAVFVSEAARDQFGGERFSSAPVVPSGATLAHNEFLPRQNSGSGIRVTCVGRLSAWKGQDVLVRSVPYLQAAGREVKVRLVGGEYQGPGKVTESLRELIVDLDLEASVSLVGEVPDPSDHYEWADVVAVPSVKPEPFGKVTIEAMNASRPVVASRQGGPAEVLGDGRGGALFEPSDPADLARAILECAESETRWEKLAHEAFEKSLLYSASTGAERIIGVCQESMTWGWQ